MAKTGAAKLQAAAMGHNSDNLNKGVDNITKIDKKIMDLKAERRDIFNKLADIGYDTKEVSAAIKIKKKPIKASFKLGVNQLCLQLGLAEEYSLTPQQIAEASGEGEGDLDSTTDDDSEAA